MADVDHYGVESDSARQSDCYYQEQILREWDRDIVRAARFHCRNRGCSEETADEYAQAARLRVWGALQKSSVPLGAPYLRRVIANATRTPLKVDHALESASEIDEADAVDTSLLQSDPLAEDAVRTWLRTLPSQLQRVYQLLFVDEYSQREAALILGISQPRVAQLHRALIERGRTELRHMAP